MATEHDDDLYEGDEEPELPDQDAPALDSFDAWWADHSQAREVETTTILGVEVDVPTDIPLEVEMLLTRKDGNLTSDDVRRAVELVFGEDVLADWMSQTPPISSFQFSVIFAWAMSHGQGKPVTFQEAAEAIREAQEAERPTNRAARRAAARPRGSATGSRSPQTSRGSTGSRRPR